MNHKLMLSLFATALVSAAAQGEMTVANGYNLTNVMVTVENACTIKILHTDGSDLDPVASKTVESASTNTIGKLDAGVVYLVVGENTTNSYINGIMEVNVNMAGLPKTNDFIEVFHSYASSSSPNHSNMAWASGMEPASISGNWYTINGTSQLNNSNTTHLESNKYLRVDTKVKYSSFAEQDDLASFDSNGSMAGIVAVSNGESKAWCALTGPSSWTTLSGVGVAPTLNADWIIRAEFDFASASDRVRYSVKGQSDSNFTTLKNDGAEWLSMAGSSNKLSSVMMTGSGGKVASVYGNIADTNMVADVDGNKYATMEKAVEAGNTNITLRTNVAGWKPTDAGSQTYVIIRDSAYDSPRLKVPTVITDGVKVIYNWPTNLVETGYFEVTNLTAGARYTWLTNGTMLTSGNANLKLLQDVSVKPGTVGVGANETLDLDGYKFNTGGGFVADGGKTIVVTNGYVSGGTGQESAAVKFVGVQMTFAAASAYSLGETSPDCIVAGHKLVRLVTNEWHRDSTNPFEYRVMPLTTSTNQLRAAKISDVGWIVVSNGWSGFSVEDDEPAKNFATKLNEDGDNGLPRWQSYVLGLDPTKKGDQPYLVPVQTTTEGQIGFKVGGKRPSNSATEIKYVAVECGSTDADIGGSSPTIDAGTATNETLESSVKYYRLKLELTPEPLSVGE